MSNERDRQTERERGHTSVCLSVCLSVFPVFAANYWIIIGGGSQFSLRKKATSNSRLEIPNERDRERDRDIRLSVCLSLCLSFTGMRWVWWKATTKTRERERERERKREFPEEFPYFWKVAPVLLNQKRQKNRVPLSLGTDILIIFWRMGGKKCHTQNNNIILTNEFLSSLSPLSFYSININRGSLQSVIRYQYHHGLLGQAIFVVVRVPRVLYASRIRDVMRRFGEI